jgi:hypothetical protein
MHEMRNRIFRAYIHRAMQGDGRTDNIICIHTYVHTYICNSRIAMHTVYVGLAQARPN